MSTSQILGYTASLGRCSRRTTTHIHAFILQSAWLAPHGFDFQADHSIVMLTAYRHRECTKPTRQLVGLLWFVGLCPTELPGIYIEGDDGDGMVDINPARTHLTKQGLLSGLSSTECHRSRPCRWRSDRPSRAYKDRSQRSHSEFW